MATPIINTNLGKVVTATGNIADDLSTLRPLLRNMLFAAFPTDKIENTPIASFPDGADGVPVKSATFAITPVQDLHGYDNPWPAWGGKNLVFAEDRSGITTQTSITGTFSLPTGTYTMSADLSDANQIGIALRLIKNGAGSSTTPYSTTISPSRKSVTFAVESTDELNLAIVGAAAGYNGSVSKVQVEAGSTPTDFAPYSNICPITGFTGAEITDAGKNLFDKNVVTNNKRLSTTTGLEESASGFCISDYIPVGAGQKIFMPRSGSSRRWFYDKNKTPKTYLNNDADQAYTATENGYVRITIATVGGFAVDINTYQVEYNSTATAYAPYIGTTHDITWSDEAGTVYGGTLQYLGGDAWRLTKTMESVDLSTLTFATYSSPIVRSTTQLPKAGGRTNMISDTYKVEAVSSVSQLSPNAICGGNSDGYIYANAATPAGNIVYELATPVTYDLTGEELATVLGQNNVFSNTGDVTELVYRADTALFVEKKLAE